MALPTQPYKGARDFYPEDKNLQNYMFGVLRRTVERFGYLEYDAPLLEPLDLYLAKTGEEIVNEQTYTFSDRGDRKVAIRPEMTPTVSRMVAAKRHQLSYPIRWYSIPNLWRYERPQRGRYREHWQLNVDMFGESSLHAEQEIISLADAIFQNFGASRQMYQIKLNSRLLTDELVGTYLDLKHQAAAKLIKLIDRKAKLDSDQFISLATEICKDKTVVNKLMAALEVSDIASLPSQLANSSAAKELKTLIDTLTTDLKLTNVVYDPSLMRGFDYYSDIVFEIFDNHPDNNRSMMGGGRYDGLVGLFGVEPIPTIGFGLGDATLQNFLELHSLLPDLNNSIDLALLLIDDVYLEAQTLITSLRSQNLNVAVDFSDRKLKNKIKWAENNRFNFVCAIGQQELKTSNLKIRNLSTSSEQQVVLNEVSTYLKNAN